MSSIGPQLPAHLQKRKRRLDDGEAPESPPSKAMRQANDDEIDLDGDSSDDGYGPSKGPAQSNTQKAPQQGPTLPESSTMPPPPKPTNRPIGPSLGPQQPIGPTPPPAPLSTRPTTGPDSGSGSDSDDDYGPRLPSSAPQPHTSSLLPTTSYPFAPPAPKRDDWMLAPPSASPGYRAAPDPTKLKSRKFATGRAAAGNEAHAGGVSAIWTETPEEKAKRLRDAVLGRGGEESGARKPAEVERAAAAAAPRSEAADEAKIRSFTEQTRGKSLYEEHQMRKKGGKGGERESGDGKTKGKKGDGEEGEEEEDDPSKRAFSWEKDMKVGGAISHSQRRELLNRSADFGGRFQKGNYL